MNVDLRKQVGRKDFVLQMGVPKDNLNQPRFYDVSYRQIEKKIIGGIKYARPQYEVNHDFE